MTQEGLKRGIIACSTMPDYKDAQLIKLLEEFFESNLCIPKGEYVQAFYGGKWNDVFNVRAKPTEPMFEWYCLYKPSTSNEYLPLGYMSQREIMEWKSEHGDAWDITYVDNTKRIRE